MRARFILLVIAILAVAAFAALNWSEFTRASPLWFGAVVMDAPLGLIMLSLLGLALLAFIISAATMRTRSLVESRHHYKTLEAQRALADKAEASRFTELRTYLDTQLRELRQRDAIAATELEKAMVNSQRELRTQLEQMNRMLSARINEMDHRSGIHRPANPDAVPVLKPARSEPVRHEPPRSEPPLQGHAMAEQAREQRIREEERVLAEEQRLREERAR